MNFTALLKAILAAANAGLAAYESIATGGALAAAEKVEAPLAAVNAVSSIIPAVIASAKA